MIFTISVFFLHIFFLHFFCIFFYVFNNEDFWCAFVFVGGGGGGGGFIRIQVEVDVSDIAIISGITNMVKAIISGITNTPQKTCHCPIHRLLESVTLLREQPLPEFLCGLRFP